MTHSSITLTAGFSRFEQGGSPCKPFQWFIRRLEKPPKWLNHSTFLCALLRQGVHENFRWRALVLWLLGLTFPLFATETRPLSTNAAKPAVDSAVRGAFGDSPCRGLEYAGEIARLVYAGIEPTTGLMPGAR